MRPLNEGNNNYFAAANGYLGFRSYFGEVFDPRDYYRIYILKGGPGTGKSSLMRRILGELGELCTHTEAILCSSDPNSLDGVILENGDKKIAVIDGTAPHATDPILPGGCETIINLGDFWREEVLISRRNELEKLNDKKRRAYSVAYDYLAITGKITEARDRIIKDCYCKEGHGLIAEYIPTEVKSKRISTRLISGFGKGGFVRLSSFGEDKRKIYLVGLYGSELWFLSGIGEKLVQGGVGHIRFPSPFDNKKTEAIEISDTKTVFVAGNPEADGAEVIDTSVLLDKGRLSAERSRLEFLSHEREVMLWGATDEFKKASDAHFSLERIYRDAMDFERLSGYINELIKNIATSLNK